jgi:hypothetical protein
MRKHAWAGLALAFALSTALAAGAESASTDSNPLQSHWRWELEGGSILGMGVDSAYGQAASSDAPADARGFGRFGWERLSPDGFVFGALVAVEGGDSYSQPRFHSPDTYAWQVRPLGLDFTPGWRYALGGGWSLESRLGIGALYSQVQATDLPSNSPGTHLIGNRADGSAFGLAVRPDLRLEKVLDDKVGLGVSLGYSFAYYLVQYRQWESAVDGPLPLLPPLQHYTFEAAPSNNFNYETSGLVLSVYLNYYYSPPF